MGIGTSHGAFYDDEFHYESAKWDDKYDDNVVTPPQMNTNKSLDKSELDPTTGLGIEVGMKLSSGKNGPYDTPLPAGDKGFQDWKEKYAPNDSGMDYDLQGAYLGGATPAENGHFPDTWKKPNHPTFSDQSKYSKDAPNSAGHWNGDEFVPPSPIGYKTEQQQAEDFNNLPDDQYMKNIDKSPGFFLREEMQQEPWKKYSDRAKSLTQQTYDHYKNGDPDMTKSVRDWESKSLTAGYNDTEAGTALKAEVLNTYGSKATMSKNAIWETYMQHLQDLAGADAEDEKHSPEMKQHLENLSLFDRVGRTQIDLKPMWAKGKYK